MITLYLVRHGETLWNVEGKMQGWNDSPLTEKGIRQAQKLGERLKNINFDVIYSSPIGRALKTAELVKGFKNTPLVLDDGLKEIKLGPWEGKSIQELKEEEPEQFNNFWHEPHLYYFQGAETFKDVRERTHKAIDSILSRNKDKKVLIVTHTIALKSIMSKFEHRPIKNLWAPPRIHQTSLTVVKVDDDNNCEIIKYADTSHLDEVKRDNITAV
jgi:broad specificity phosphatase PhoE